MTLIIAEAGVNHNGDKRLAFELIDAAVEAGADIVKFQTFKAEGLASSIAKQATYQQINTNKVESQLNMLKKLELDYELHYELKKYCEKKNIEFLSTAFEQESLSFLTNEIKLKRLKIPSGEITNAPFLLQHARTGLDIILSTGMAGLGEIESALGVLAFAMTAGSEAKPSQHAFELAYLSDNGQRALREKVTLLHCTTEYPAQPSDINLRAMDTIATAFGLPVGYSDHSEGIHIAVAAVARGAKIIEKHFTVDRSLPGPDHKASLEPEELAKMVCAIREVEQSLGDGVKRPANCELKNKDVARKSLVAKRAILKGEIFTEDNIAVKRPGSGRSPFEFWKIIGEISQKNYCKDEII